MIVLGVRALFADQTGIDLTDALPFSGYQAIIGVVILLFAGITTPELLCPDRRDGMLQLYFSTAVSRGEYLAGRVIGAIVPLLLVTMVPMLVLYAGILVFEEHPVGYLQDHWAELPRIVAAGVILAVYYGLIGLAVSSLTGRRAFAIGGYLLLLVAPTVLRALLQEAFDRRRGARPRRPVDAADRLRRRDLPGRPRRHPQLAWRVRDRVPRGRRRGGDRPAAPLPAREPRRDDRPRWSSTASRGGTATRWPSPTSPSRSSAGVTGLLGHNGAGKSTALKLCAGFTRRAPAPSACSGRTSPAGRRRRTAASASPTTATRSGPS